MKCRVNKTWFEVIDDKVIIITHQNEAGDKICSHRLPKHILVRCYLIMTGSMNEMDLAGPRDMARSLLLTEDEAGHVFSVPYLDVHGFLAEQVRAKVTNEINYIKQTEVLSRYGDYHLTDWASKEE